MDIHLTLIGPILTQSTNPGGMGLDSVVARHSNIDKTPYLPGTLITGKLRQALEELQDVVNKHVDGSDSQFNPQLDNWLGQSRENDFPKSRQLYFSDFDLSEDNHRLLMRESIRDRITIEEETGAVKPQHIVMIENPFVSGQDYTFTGQLHFFSPEQQVNHILKHIKTGFNWFSQLGALKSVGFGQVKEVNFENLQQNNITINLTNEQSEKGLMKNEQTEKISLWIKPDYPFCLPDKPVADNLFESAVIIPGGAIIGSIATTWSHLQGQHNGRINTDIERKALQENFSKIRISHAFPSSQKSLRPVVPPLSLVKVEQESSDPELEETSQNQLYDVSELSNPCLINNKPPDFAMDWKYDQNTLGEYPWPFIRSKDWGWATLKSEFRVRSAIDRESKRSQKGELFAYEQIIPEDQYWNAELDLSRIEDKAIRMDVLEQLQSLLQQGVIGLGKTKTPASIEFVRQKSDKQKQHEQNIQSFFRSSLTPRKNPNERQQWVITLQTDALIGIPENLDEKSGQDDLRTMYKNAWKKELSDNSLELIRYFARQKFSGGRYRKAIFQQKDQLYRPWLLTEAGSVFVLQANGSIDAAQKKIEKWLEQGLPLSPKVIQYYSVSPEIDQQWQQCPFIPQNGYGEIAVNIKSGSQTIVLNDKDPRVTLIGPVIQQGETSK